MNNWQKAYYEWKMYGATDRVMRYFENTNVLDPIYLSCLLAKNETGSLDKLVTKYIQKQSNSNISQYIPLHAYIARNFRNDFYSIPDKIFTEIEERGTFILPMVKGKTVAIIGNGRSTAGKSKGKEIDNHDIVIRFNDYHLQGYNEDIGTKTDVWCVGAINRERDHRNHVEKILYAWDLACYNTPIFSLNDMTDDYKNGNGLDYIRGDVQFPLKERLGEWPSSGITVAWFLKRYCDTANIDYYGFAFQQDDNSICNHYYKNGERKPQFHDFSKESRFFMEELI